MTRKIEALAAKILRCTVCAGGLEFHGDYATCTRCDHRFSFAGNCLQMDPSPSEGPSKRGSGGTSLWPSWGYRFESYVYARHNRSPAIRAALAGVLQSLDDGVGVGLNLGSGFTSLHPRLLNLDVTCNATLDLTGDAHALPFADNSLRCVVSQEVFEHLARPWVAIRDVARVLSPGGRAYIQVPFIIGMHAIPHDYYRFTPHGLRELVESAGLLVVEIAAAVGAGTAAYRVFVDFWGTLAGAVTPRAYRPAKAVAALVGAPLRWFDRPTMQLSDTNRAAAGFYVIAEKVSAD